MQLRRMALALLATSLLTACNLNVQVPGSSNEQQAAATIVAQTLQAAGTQPAAASPVAQASPTYSKPMLAITGNSNCRTGPGASFKVVTAFTAGTDLELVAKSSSNNFWQVKIPNSEETCWVWGQYATASGSVDTLQEAAPVSSSASGAPAQPGALFYSFECSNGSISTSLSWSDNADNETGYRVYRFDQLVVDLAPQSTSYTDVEPLPPGTFLQYSVAAYNDAGESPKRVQEFTACP